LIQHDAYYKDNSHLKISEREQINYDHPDALETELLIKHLKQLINGQTVTIPQYDFSSHSRRKSGLSISPADVIIIDGILIFVDGELRKLMDVKIFVDTETDLRLLRRLKRDLNERNRTLQSVIEQYLKTVKPMHDAFVEPSRRYADLILPEGMNPVSINIVTGMIKHRRHLGGA
jgi:uridine kinase